MTRNIELQEPTAIVAMGAIATAGVRVLNDEVTGLYGIPPPVVDTIARQEHAELERGTAISGRRQITRFTSSCVLHRRSWLARHGEAVS
jgi:predicted phosphoribosyltransferase